MDKKIVLMFIFLLILGAVGVNKIIQDSNVNTTQTSQQNTTIDYQNTGTNQQNLPTSSNSYSTDSSNVSTSNTNQAANINTPDSTSSSSNSRQYE